MQLFLTRGVVAIAWAAVFAAVSDSLTTGLTVGAGILVVLYPLIDVVASLIDARSQHGSARRLLLAGAAVSAVAAVALGAAATGSVADVLFVLLSPEASAAQAVLVASLGGALGLWAAGPAMPRPSWVGSRARSGRGAFVVGQVRAASSAS
jgi:hypothetical protein